MPLAMIIICGTLNKNACYFRSWCYLWKFILCLFCFLSFHWSDKTDSWSSEMHPVFRVSTSTPDCGQSDKRKHWYGAPVMWIRVVRWCSFKILHDAFFNLFLFCPYAVTLLIAGTQSEAQCPSGNVGKGVASGGRFSRWICEAARTRKQ